jgi:hypothetical protein
VHTGAQGFRRSGVGAESGPEAARAHMAGIGGDGRGKER